MGSCAAPSAKGDDKFITTDYLQQCQKFPSSATKNKLCHPLANRDK
ncbi:replication initiator protein [Escherichia coli]|nr:replication initiator protein [Escherichia coli]